MATPSNIILANLTTPPVKGLTSPFIATAPGMRDGTRQVGPNPPVFTLSATSDTITAIITQGNGADSYEIRVDSGPAISGLKVSGLNPEQTYAVQIRGFFGQEAGAWATAVNQATTAAPTGVLFTENFDDQPDYTNTMHSTETKQDAASGFTIPNDWDTVYGSPEWSPEKGYPDHYATVNILASTPGRGESGKCYRGTRESIDSTGGSFQSDGQLIKAPIDRSNQDGTDELYVEFWIRFSENWYQRVPTNPGYPMYPGGSFKSKIFRCSHWTPGENMISGGAFSDLGPMLYWDYEANNYGVRNNLAFRGGPPGNVTGQDNYKNGPVDNGFSGSHNYNARDLVGQEVGGATPYVEDLVNGGNLAETEDLVSHEMLFGPADHWTKLAFYVKMNSAPGVADGICSQYLNGQRIRHHDNIPWVQSHPQNLMVKWNHFSIGGNDYFLPYDGSQLFEDYYFIDDIVVMDSLPETFI